MRKPATKAEPWLVAKIHSSSSRRRSSLSSAFRRKNSHPSLPNTHGNKASWWLLPAKRGEAGFDRKPRWTPMMRADLWYARPSLREMKRVASTTGSDRAWEELGRARPYWAIRNHASRAEFFASGEEHAA